MGDEQDTPPVEIEWDPEELRTDPEPFGPRLDEVTKRRCGGCGSELAPDDRAFLRGAFAVLNAAFVYLQRRGLAREEAEAVVLAVREETGV